MEYYGNADLRYYGLEPHDFVPHTDNEQGRQDVDCLAAISASILYGQNFGRDFSWLRQLKPVDRVGGFIYIYDLRKTRP